MQATKSPPNRKSPLVWPLLLSILVGFIFVWPNVLMPFLQRDPSCTYTPLITTTYELEETVYASGIREVFDGRLCVRDAQLYEHKDEPSFIPRFPYLALGLLARLLGSVPRVFVVCDFALPAAIFLLAYMLLFQLTRDPWLSAAGGVVLLFGYHLVPYIPLMPRRLIQEIVNYQHGMRPIDRFSRLPYNQFSFALLLLATFLIYLAVTRAHGILLVVAALVGALTFYTYFYHYTYLSAACFTMWIVSLLRGDKQVSRRLILLLVLMSFFSIPFWVSYIRFTELPQYGDILSRMGIELKTVGLLQLCVLAQVSGYLLLSWLLLRTLDFPFCFLASFLVAGVLCYCIPIAVGFGIQSFHWSSNALDPYIILLLAYVFSAARKMDPASPFARKIASAYAASQRGLCVLLILFFLAYGLYIHTRYSINTKSEFCMPRSLTDAFAWLDAHTESDAVVASTSIHTINLLPAYSHCNNYAPNALMTAASSEEIIDRLCILYRLYGVPIEFVEKVLQADNMLADLIRSFPDTRTVSPHDIDVAYWSGNFFHAKFAFGPWNANQPYRFPEEVQERIRKSFMLYVPLDVREAIRSTYERYLHEDPRNLLHIYRLDYLFYGPFEEQISDLDFSRHPFLTPVYARDGIEIFRVTP